MKKLAYTIENHTKIISIDNENKFKVNLPHRKKRI